MKLRQLPEDFKVFEISTVKTSEKGGYKLFLLRKEGLESFSLIESLSQKNNIPQKEFGIAGLKDKHAVTEQYFTIPAKYELKTLEGEGYQIRFVGFSENAISLGDLEGNYFEIIVRAIKGGELDGISVKAKTIPLIGVPNYFDSQRFGSAFDKDFVAKYLIKKDYEGAVKAYLTRFPPFELKWIKREKSEVLKLWKRIAKRDNSVMSSLKLRNYEMRTVLETYFKSGSWIDAYKRIKPSIREMMVSAYQSYLWNECVKILLRKYIDIKNLYTVEYAVGKLLYYKELSPSEKEKLPKAFRTISDDAEFSELEKKIVKKVLSMEDLKIEDFNIKEATGNFFKSHERQLILVPEDFLASFPEIDEQNTKNRDRNNKFFKIKLSFTLPKGSYATVITKRLFNQ